jgi:hypothetical protein
MKGFLGSDYITLRSGECIKVQAARSPGDNPGFEECYRLERISSGELAKCFGEPCPEGLRGRKRYLLGECCEFLGLLGQRLELLA